MTDITAPSEAPFRIDSSAAGWLRIVAAGKWEAESTEAYWREVERGLARTRPEEGHAKILIDAQNWVDSVETVEASFAKWTALLANAADRVGIVLPTSMSKARMKSAIKDPRFQAFTSPVAAEMWISAYG